MKGTNIDGDVSVSNNVSTGGDAHVSGTVSVGHDLKVRGWLDAPNIKGPCKGLFKTVEILRFLYPYPRKGWYAFVGFKLPADIYSVENGVWIPTGEQGGVNVDLTPYMLKDEALAELNKLKNKCAELEDKIGQGGGGEGGKVEVDGSLSSESMNPVSNSVITENFNSVNRRLDELMAGNVKLTLSVSPAAMFVKETKDVTVTARVTGGKAQITITGPQGAEWQSEGPVGSFTHVDKVTAVAGLSASYTARARIYGKDFSATAKVEGYHPCYIGAGTESVEVAVEQYKVKVPKGTVAGDYKVQVEQGQKVYILIPQSVELDTSDIYLGKNPFPMQQNGNMYINGVTYKVYESGIVNETILLNIKIE